MESAEFAEGMVTPHRSRMLGDIGRSDPAQWVWGGDRADPVHALLMLFAIDAGTLATLEGEVVADPTSAGLRQVVKLETSDLGDREHFGFHDGIGASRKSWRSEIRSSTPSRWS